MSLLSIDFKILKALANCIQYIKRIMHHNEVGFIPRLQGWFNTWKWITMLIIQHINKLKKKSTWIHKSTQKKTFDKMRHPFMNNTFRKIEIKGNFLSLIKSIDSMHTHTHTHTQNLQQTSHLTLKAQLVSSMIRNKESMSSLTTLIKHHGGRQEKEILI